MITAEQIAQIEITIEKRAEEIAYRQTDHFSDRQAQSTIYELIKSSIILGARLFQEQLSNLETV